MKKLFTTLLYLPLLFISCSDELNLEPTSVITNANFWKTENDAEGALAGMYVDLRIATREDLFILGEARSEVPTYGTAGDAGYAKYYNNTLSAADAGPSWQSWYYLINSANLILKYIPNIPFSSEDKKNDMLAQAYTMRAFAYFVMVRTWGKLVLRTEPLEGFNAEVTQKERSSVEDVFQLIKKDLDMAISLFPNNDFPSGRNMWSKPAANTLKGDVYLWTGKLLNGGESDFNIALSALNEVESANVELLPEFSDIFDFDNKGNNEIIMAVRFERDEVGNNYFWRMYMSAVSVPAGIDQYTRDLIGAPGGNNIMTPSELVRDQFLIEDARRDATFYEVYTYDDEGSPSYNTTITQKGTGTVEGGSRLFLSDIILYRYADVLLMKAEAKNALGQDPSTEINLVRQRAYGDNFDDHVFVSGTKEENSEAILKERLLEFALEGKRWWDLIRFGKAFDIVPALQDRKDEDHLLLFPISNEVLSLEPSIEQNPGY